MSESGAMPSAARAGYVGVGALNERVPGRDATVRPSPEAFSSADAIVVGSGPGASVAILRPAEAGRSVVVLERGDPGGPIRTGPAGSAGVT